MVCFTIKNCLERDYSHPLIDISREKMIKRGIIPILLSNLVQGDLWAGVQAFKELMVHGMRNFCKSLMKSLTQCTENIQVEAAAQIKMLLGSIDSDWPGPGNDLFEALISCGMHLFDLPS